MAQQTTLLLDVLGWDLTLDTAGNMAIASKPYSIAQDAASALRLFLGELYFDTTQGVPYFASILGQTPPIELMRALFQKAALTVPGVISAKCFFSGVVDRRLTGQIQVTDTDRVTAAAGF